MYIDFVYCRNSPPTSQHPNQNCYRLSYCLKVDRPVPGGPYWYPSC